MDFLLALWLRDNHSAFTACHEGSWNGKTWRFGQHHGKWVPEKKKKKRFSQWKLWGLWKMSNCLLIWIYSYFVPFEIYVYIIFWNIIYSLQEMNSATVWDSWCITLSFRCFALLLFVVISFLLARKVCPFERSTGHSHCKASSPWTPGIWGIMILNQELPSVRTRCPRKHASCFTAFCPVQ